MRAAIILLAMLATLGPAAAETIHLYAAGSLKSALTDVAKAFEAVTGNTVVPREAQVDLGAGTVSLGGFSFGEHDSAGGSGTLLTLTFTAQGLGDSLLELSDVQLARRCGLRQPAPTVFGGRVVSDGFLYRPLIPK